MGQEFTVVDGSRVAGKTKPGFAARQFGPVLIQIFETHEDQTNGHGCKHDYGKVHR